MEIKHVCDSKMASKNCFTWHLQILEEEKVHQKLTFGEYPLYLVPLDDDVLSLELDHSLQVLLHISSICLSDILNLILALVIL